VNRPIRVAVQIQPQHATYDQIRQAVVRAEEVGVDAVFNWDHFYPLYGGNPDPVAGAHFECWTMLASWAEVTERVEIGALVTCNSYRNPDLLADMARTVDHISNGRLILGIGSGWFEKDYVEYGYEFNSAGWRLNRLEEALPRIEARLAKLDPSPMREIPILIGGGGETKTLRYTARHAHIWHSFGDVETFKHKNGVLERWCAEEGTDSAGIERSVAIEPPNFDQADALADAGVTLFTVGLNGPDYDLGSVAELLAWRDGRN
jgi:probable F420-dependent oxidoreductase